MRILHVRASLAPNAGGPTTVLSGLAAAQAKRGHDITVCTTDRGLPPTHRLSEDFFRELFPREVEVKPFSVIYPTLLYSPAMGKWLRRHLGGYDIIHIHGLYRFPPTYAAYQARKQGIPYIIRPHGVLDPYLYDKGARSIRLKRLYERFFDRKTLNSADAIQYTTEEERGRAAFWNISAPSFIVPNGIDWARFSSLPKRGAFRTVYGFGDAPLVLFLGRLHLKKGLDLLIPAFDEVRRRAPSARLAIVGPENDEYGKRVRGWVAERGIGNSVKFIGHLDGDKVTEAYVDADVFALPSYTENFGMTVVEAMACGLPVVISDQVNIHSEVTKAEAGIVTGCDVHEVSRAITALLSDSERRSAMGAAARKAAKDLYSWETVVDSLDDEYKRVILHHRERTLPHGNAASGEPR